MLPSCIESQPDLVRAVVGIEEGATGCSTMIVGSLSESLMMFGGGGNIYKATIARREILININGQLRTPMHNTWDRLSSEWKHIVLVMCWFNYRFEFEL